MRSLIPPATYHSAHRPPAAAPPLGRWEGDGCLAFVHDLMASPALPAEFDACDVLTAEIPWQRGFKTFNVRAGIEDGRTYAAFLQRVSEVITGTAVPIYLITGRHALSRLPEPETMTETRLNEWDALILGYRPDPRVGSGTYGVVQEMLHAIAQRYDVVGDFCCGYGRAGRFFLRAGKRAVLSDFDPQCIGYVAEHAAEWVP